MHLFGLFGKYFYFVIILNSQIKNISQNDAYNATMFI